MISTSTLTISELIDLSSHLASINLGYLVVCVTIILFAGGLFYVFNFKPLQKSIEKQDIRLSELSAQISNQLRVAEERSSNLVLTQSKELKQSLLSATQQIELLKKEAFDKISKAEKQTSDFSVKAEKELELLKKKAQKIELESLWMEHYMWDGRKVPVNALRTLIQYMHKAQEYDVLYLEDLWLDNVFKLVKNLKIENPKTVKEVQEGILVLLSKIKGKKEAVEKVKDVTNNLS